MNNFTNPSFGQQYFKRPVRGDTPINCTISILDQYDYYPVSELEITNTNNLVNWKIDKTTPGKMFGFATAQKLTVEAVGPISDEPLEGRGIKVRLWVVKPGESVSSWYSPCFWVEKYEYDEVTNRSTIEAYDLIHLASKVLVADIINPQFPTTLTAYTQCVLDAIKPRYNFIFEGADCVLKDTPNFSQDTDLATVLNAIAEVSGSICIATCGGSGNTEKNAKTIAFRQVDTTPVDEITSDLYTELSIGKSEILSNIVHKTELGQTGYYGNEGYTQVLRENAFITLASGEDLNLLMTSIASKALGITATTFSMKWKGIPTYEPGDMVRIHKTDGTYKDVIIYDEILTYNGGLSSQLSFTVQDSENPEAKPVGIAGAMRQTSAKVDKVNNEIVLMSRIDDTLMSQMSEIKLNAESISASVEETQKTISNMVDTMEEQIDTLTKKVGLAITSENLAINVQKTLSDGVSAVTTTTGFTFDEVGLTIDKTGSEMSTVISEDGMKVARNGEVTLTANNVGVEAINLYATTFLTIGLNSRFENYDDDTRTGCFWIGN